MSAPLEDWPRRSVKEARDECLRALAKAVDADSGLRKAVQPTQQEPTKPRRTYWQEQREERRKAKLKEQDASGNSTGPDAAWCSLKVGRELCRKPAALGARFRCVQHKDAEDAPSQPELEPKAVPAPSALDRRAISITLIEVAEETEAPWEPKGSYRRQAAALATGELPQGFSGRALSVERLLVRCPGCNKRVPQKETGRLKEWCGRADCRRKADAARKRAQRARDVTETESEFLFS